MLSSSDQDSCYSPVVSVDMGSKKRGHENFVELMDEVERQVERLRSNVAYLEEEKDAISIALDSIRQSDYMADLEEESREEILINVDRLSARIASVEVRVNTVRNDAQQDALYEVNEFIDKLVMEMSDDMENARARCIIFINTCCSYDNDGPTDKSFESALLGCTLDDQKRIRKRLHGLKTYFDKLAVVQLND